LLFDEIEKASDALWNLLLGILDKATLTLSDNRRIDFSSTMIFLTSNLGAGEMRTLIAPPLDFGFPRATTGTAKLSARISRTGIEAARRKFTPEFINRLDKIVVFKSLATRNCVGLLISSLKCPTTYSVCAAGNPFSVNVTDSAKQFLLMEGTTLVWRAPPEGAPSSACWYNRYQI